LYASLTFVFHGLLTTVNLIVTSPLHSQVHRSARVDTFTPYFLDQLMPKRSQTATHTMTTRKKSVSTENLAATTDLSAELKRFFTNADNVTLLRDAICGPLVEEIRELKESLGEKDRTRAL
jgi:hypothetical protein